MEKKVIKIKKLSDIYWELDKIAGGLQRNDHDLAVRLRELMDDIQAYDLKDLEV